MDIRQTADEIQRQPQVLAMLERRQLAPTTTSADMLPAYQQRGVGGFNPPLRTPLSSTTDSLEFGYTIRTVRAAYGQ